MTVSAVPGHDAIISAKGRKRGVALSTALAIIFIVEGHPGLVERDQTVTRNCDPVGVAGQLGEHGLRARERRLGVGDPLLFPCRRQMAIVCTPISPSGSGAAELEPPAGVKLEMLGSRYVASRCVSDKSRLEHRPHGVVGIHPVSVRLETVSPLDNEPGWLGRPGPLSRPTLRQ